MDFEHRRKGKPIGEYSVFWNRFKYRDPMEDFRIFIVDDDPWYSQILEYHLSLNPEFQIDCFNSGKECISNLHLNPDLITIDYSMDDMSGGELLKKLLQWGPDVPIIVISGQEEVSVALSLLKEGAYDYLIKDDSTKDLLWNAVVRARETHSLKKEVEQLHEQLEKKFTFEKSIIGQSQPIKKTFKMMEKACKTSINVSITGETGTGKELVAKAIHYNSRRRKKPFVPVNMAAIPRELVESELFGHEKGAFTGAVARKKGKFEEAQGGTIFLDEIAELDLNLQTKLLRVLQEREVVRVGGNETIKLNVRVIVATHKDLKNEVQEGAFREDLFYRLIGLPISLPPLRERGQDILLLAHHFADSFVRENKLEKLKLNDEAKDKLLSYNYPGNVRELKAVIDLAVVLCEDNLISMEDINFTAVKGDKAFLSQEKSLREYSCEIVKFFLKKYNNDVVGVAKRLNVGKSTIYKMIQDKEIILE
ncbi:MAG: sigma-54 dependent transcriptional regulator [Flavobacteriales bacterium]|nr:sigma-54 dependent transcriptional regulator [Flavobacteriales bacterium]